MEKEELKLKPFNLEAAKRGKPVCTRDGRKARIICFDLKDRDNYYSIVAIIETDGYEVPCKFSKEGKFEYNSIILDDNDLMMLPEKKEGWINIYPYSKGNKNIGSSIFNSKEEALENAVPNLIDTIKIEWEE